jgi:hypothetical protein
MQGRLRTPAEGADTVVWLAASPAARGRSGLFWFDRRPRSPHLLPWTRETASQKTALRQLCERATGAAVPETHSRKRAVSLARRAASRR